MANFIYQKIDIPYLKGFRRDSSAEQIIQEKIYYFSKGVSLFTIEYSKECFLDRDKKIPATRILIDFGSCQKNIYCESFKKAEKYVKKWNKITL